MSEPVSASGRLPAPIGLFGGTFDPVHFGHLRLAEEALTHLGLGQVCWIPAGQPPHRGTPQVTARNRLEMVLRSTAGNPRFSVDDSEIRSNTPSYTVHTLRRLRAELGPEQPLVLLVGADAFAGLPGWHCWEEILTLTHIGISHRPGFPIEASSLPPALLHEFSQRHHHRPELLQASAAGTFISFAMTQLAISATQIRKLLANHLSIRYLLPESVVEYIHTHQLYRSH